MRFYAGTLAVFFGFALTVAAQPKRPLEHRDYDGWRSIQTQALSRDGKFLAYGVFPEDGDGELVVRNLATGKEARENAGAVPLTPEPSDLEPAGEQGPPAPRTIHVAFTHDSRFLVSTAFPLKDETEKAKKEHKRADEMPRGSMIVVDLTAMSAVRVPDVESFQVPESGGSFVVYLKGSKPAASSPSTEQQDLFDQGRGGRGGNQARGARKKYGSELVLRDLLSSKEWSFADVLEYSISKDARALVYAVGSQKEETDGIYAAVPGNDASPVVLLAGKGRYTKLTWDFSQKELAFLSDRDDAAGKPARFKAYVWERNGAPVEILSAASDGFHPGWAIFDRGAMNFSRDGSRLFVSCAPVEEIAEAEKESPAGGANPSADDKVLADLWSWKDDYIQPMQKVRAPQERTRSYRAVIDLASKKFVQLSDPTMIGLTPSDDGRMAMGMDDRAYRHMVDFDTTYNDIYFVDTATGARKLALKQFRGNGGGRGGGGVQWSPDGSRLLAFKDKQWWAVATDGSAANLTEKLGVAFYNEDHDTPDEPNSYGSAGWTKDGKWALVYDRFDVWAVSADGTASKKLTNGRASALEFRVARFDTQESEEEHGIDPSKPLLLRAENLETRDTGFYTLANFDRAQPAKLIMGAKNYRVLGKAKDADVVMMTATTFHDEPDIFITDSALHSPKRVTDANPQMAKLLWGSGELIRYRNADGVELPAALYKPENFDPQKKYPMMVYIYERLSQNVNNFVRPAPGTSINLSYYVSNGYLVLTPDIIYTTGHPGQSALKCVLPAIQAVVDKGFVNRDAIGIQGHSWGGYQTAYMLTQTNVFRAAEAGAPVVNMLSAYDGIRWGSGLPRQFQYEKSQSRIGGSIWEQPLKFIENSPIFMVDRITTPVLILENDGDDAVPWYQGIEFFLSLRRLGKEAYMWNYNGEAHGLRKRPTQKDYTVRMQQYFDHFLKGAPAPEWMTKGISYLDREQEKEKTNAIYSGTGGDGKMR